MSKEHEEHALSTADFVSAEPRALEREREGRPLNEDWRQRSEVMTDRPTRETAQEQEALADLFLAGVAEDFRSRWDAIQIAFVDDPGQSVQKADELVAQVMKSLAETFARQRASIEADVDHTDQASTENLRVALRRYRSFFQRLLLL